MWKGDMNFIEYSNQNPLTRTWYKIEDVHKIREHAFKAGAGAKKKLTRSQQQNRYYWGVVCKILGDEIGYEPEEIHQLLGRQFLLYRKNETQFVKSTTRLNTREFEEYMEQCRRFASMELNIWIPQPNEAGDLSYDAPKK